MMQNRFKEMTSFYRQNSIVWLLIHLLSVRFEMQPSAAIH